MLDIVDLFDGGLKPSPLLQLGQQAPQGLSGETAVAILQAELAERLRGFLIETICRLATLDGRFRLFDAVQIVHDGALFPAREVSPAIAEHFPHSGGCLVARQRLFAAALQVEMRLPLSDRLGDLPECGTGLGFQEGYGSLSLVSRQLS